jgi:hypothetical protein
MRAFSFTVILEYSILCSACRISPLTARRAGRPVSLPVLSRAQHNTQPIPVSFTPFSFILDPDLTLIPIHQWIRIQVRKVPTRKGKKEETAHVLKNSLEGWKILLKIGRPFKMFFIQRISIEFAELFSLT